MALQMIKLTKNRSFGFVLTILGRENALDWNLTAEHIKLLMYLVSIVWKFGRLLICLHDTLVMLLNSKLETQGLLMWMSFLKGLWSWFLEIGIGDWDYHLCLGLVLWNFGKRSTVVDKEKEMISWTSAMMRCAQEY